MKAGDHPPGDSRLPPQGTWSDDDYLRLTDHCNRLIEFTDGCVQELRMPTFTHRAVLLSLNRLFHDYLTPRGGVAIVAALRLRVREGSSASGTSCCSATARIPVARITTGWARTWSSRW